MKNREPDKTPEIPGIPKTIKLPLLHFSSHRNR
nr:MAG TPA: hypothetical protein [Bacteriophage sp.]